MALRFGQIFSHLKIVLFIVVCLGIVIALPMLVVWKQVYISSAAIRQEKMADSIEVLNRTLAELSLVGGQLSSTARIERIAKEKLSLDYPTAAQIEVVRLAKEDKGSIFDLPVLSAIRKTLTQSRK